MNAGHEATVHTLGNGIKAILEHGKDRNYLRPKYINSTVEEILRYDPPLHMFTRYAYEDIIFRNHKFKCGDQVALVIGAAGRDERIWASPNKFDPFRRLELVTALPIIFKKFPNIKLLDQPIYSNLYHFHGLQKLNVSLQN